MRNEIFNIKILSTGSYYLVVKFITIKKVNVIMLNLS